MTDVSQVGDALTRLGFTDHEQHPAADPARVAALSHNGEYKVLGAWVKDNVIVHVEQNSAPESFTDENGVVFASQSPVTYPPVITIEHVQDDGAPFDPAHRMSVTFGDLDALFAVLGVTDSA